MFSFKLLKDNFFFSRLFLVLFLMKVRKLEALVSKEKCAGKEEPKLTMTD